MTRFFIPAQQIKEQRIFLDGEDRHHFLHVLRQGVGAEILVLNGKGEEYLVRIIEVTPETVVGEIINQVKHSTEPQVKLLLVQSLPKADKFEFILQKNTELGVSAFQPVISERSLIKLDLEQARKKEERWRKIIREAAEQSGRQVIPDLEPVRSWESFFRERKLEGLWLIPWEGEREKSLKQVLNEQKQIPESVTIFVGPEGGFSQSEVKLAFLAGAVPVTLGPRILRTETAGLVSATAILYHFGDLG